MRGAQFIRPRVGLPCGQTSQKHGSSVPHPPPAFLLQGLGRVCPHLPCLPPPFSIQLSLCKPVWFPAEPSSLSPRTLGPAPQTHSQGRDKFEVEISKIVGKGWGSQGSSQTHKVVRTGWNENRRSLEEEEGAHSQPGTWLRPFLGPLGALQCGRPLPAAASQGPAVEIHT